MGLSLSDLDPTKGIKKVGELAEDTVSSVGDLFESVGKEFGRFIESDLGKVAIAAAVVAGGVMIAQGMAASAPATGPGLGATAGAGETAGTVAANEAAKQTAVQAATETAVAGPPSSLASMTPEGVAVNSAEFAATGAETAAADGWTVEAAANADKAQAITEGAGGNIMGGGVDADAASHMANLPADQIVTAPKPTFMDKISASMKSMKSWAAENPWPATYIGSQVVSTAASAFGESPAEEAARLREEERKAANARMRSRLRPGGNAPAAMPAPRPQPREVAGRADPRAGILQRRA